MEGKQLGPSPLALVAVLLLGGPLLAHDLWLEPASFRAEAGTALDVTVRVGESFVGEAVLLDSRRIVRLFRAGPDGIFDLERTPTGVPAARTGPLAVGTHALAYESGPFRHEMSGGAFSKYLAEEGLDSVLARRRERGEERAIGRESYRRSVKGLVAIGEGPAAPRDRALGLPLELLLEARPERGPGEAQLRVLFRGAPLPGVLLTAVPRNAPEAARSARSDGDGRAVLLLDRPGAWLVKGVHIEEAAAGLDADWASWWTSLTFAIPEP
jgi:hypothetical protein